MRIDRNDRDFLAGIVIAGLILACIMLVILHFAHAGDIKHLRGENATLSNRVDILNDTLALEQASKRACANEVKQWREFYQKSGGK